MSVARGSSSMRSRVERRMRRETGKTLREIRRARKLRKKLMTDEERLMYNLRRVRPFYKSEKYCLACKFQDFLV